MLLACLQCFSLVFLSRRHCRGCSCSLHQGFVDLVVSRPTSLESPCDPPTLLERNGKRARVGRLVSSRVHPHVSDPMCLTRQGQLDTAVALAALLRKCHHSAFANRSGAPHLQIRQRNTTFCNSRPAAEPKLGAGIFQIRVCHTCVAHICCVHLLIPTRVPAATACAGVRVGHHQRGYGGLRRQAPQKNTCST